LVWPNWPTLISGQKLRGLPPWAIKDTDDAKGVEFKRQ
jgi:hypothetical protein